MAQFMTHDTTIRASDSAINSVLRSTYLLLSMTLVFSAVMAMVSMSMNITFINPLIFIGGWFGLSYLTNATRNSGWGLISIFAFTEFAGFCIGPILNFYIHAYSNGGQLVMTSLGATGVVFFALSAFVITTRKDFTYMGGMLFVMGVVGMLLGIGAMVFQMPILSLAVSGFFALFSSGYILYTTSAVINGGERNYIMATIMLYVALFNLFLSLLRILSFFSGNRN